MKKYRLPIILLAVFEAATIHYAVAKYGGMKDARKNG